MQDNILIQEKICQYTILLLNHEVVVIESGDFFVPTIGRLGIHVFYEGH